MIKNNGFFIFLIAVLCIKVFFHCLLLETCTEKDPSSFVSDIPVIKSIRQKSAHRVRVLLPSPHSELLLGIVLGINDLDLVPEFKELVRKTGTVHVIVVSGYNINFVYLMILSRLGTFYNKRNFIVAACLVLFYSLLSGFEPPVVRAWIMGTLILLLKIYGRSVPPMRVLFFSTLLMLIYNINYLFNLSFQLSFMAALSLMLFSPILSEKLKSNNIFATTFVETLSAQVLVVPFLSYKFGEVSATSLIANTLVLWLIPICTFLGFLFFGVLISNGGLSTLMTYIIYPYLDVFVKTLYIFDSLSFNTIRLPFTLNMLLVYYFLCFIVYIKILHKNL